MNSEQAQRVAWAHRTARPEDFEVVTRPASELECILQEVDTPQKLNSYWQEWPSMRDLHDGLSPQHLGTSIGAQ